MILLYRIINNMVFDGYRMNDFHYGHFIRPDQREWIEYVKRLK